MPHVNVLGVQCAEAFDNERMEILIPYLPGHAYGEGQGAGHDGD